MKTQATLTMVILMAYPALLGGMIIADCLLLLVAFFTGWWWPFILGCLATAGLVAWHRWIIFK